MINELIEQIGGRERLEALASFRPSGSNTVNSASRDEWMAMARALLEVLDAKPVAWQFLTDNNKWLGVYDPNDALKYGYQVRALYATSLATSAPEGWKLVPVEPTAKMMVAGTLVSEFQEDPAGMYRAMIAAAPAPGDY